MNKTLIRLIRMLEKREEMEKLDDSRASILCSIEQQSSMLCEILSRRVEHSMYPR